MTAYPNHLATEAVPRAWSHTKVVATIGPASEHRVGELIRAGMSVARINFSHGTPDEHRKRVLAIRSAAEEAGVELGILADIPGPKMRLGLFKDGRLELKAGQEIIVRNGKGIAGPGEVLFRIDGFLEAVRAGHRMVLADGQVELITLRREGDGLVARVSQGGMLGDRKGVHLPDSEIGLGVPTPDDVKWIALAREMGVDLLGISFVSKPEEIRTVRELAPGIGIVSKIERRAALERLEGILEASDGIMIARGDLGVELPLHELPLWQKHLITEAYRSGKFTITATEMLESMVENQRPTRAEVSDVANAVLDGTDALMLSAETAVGLHPVEAVATMTKIALRVEQSQRYQEVPRRFRTSEPTFSNAMALAAVQAAEALGIAKIVCFSETGNTVRQVTRYRPSAEVLALSPNADIVRQMTPLAHVRPIVFDRGDTLEDMLFGASEMLESAGLAREGEPVVFVAGVPPGVAKTTNLMKLHRIGEPLRLH